METKIVFVVGFSVKRYLLICYHSNSGSSIFYLIRESFRSIFQHRMILLPSILTITLCAFILCGTIQLLVLGYTYSNMVTEHFQIEAFLFDDLSLDSDVIHEEIVRIGNLDSVVYVSKDDAISVFIDQFGSEMIENIEGNPLPASFKVYPGKNIQSLVNMRKLIYKIQKIEGVETVNSSLDTIQLIEEWKSTFYFWALVISAGLLIMLWLIISNSVRLTLFSREILVENMHFCGANESFIQFPFVVEGFFQGFIGCSLALGAWYVVMWAVNMIAPFITSIMSATFWVLPVVGLAIALLGAFTSFRVVHNYMRNAEAYNA